MTSYAVALNEDVNGVKTSAEWDGTQWIMPTDGTTAIGDPADAAVTNPASSATMVALLKGLLSSMKAEDVAALAGDLGVVGLAIRRDTAVSDVGTAGDYTPLHVDAFGRLRVTGTQLEDAAHTSGDAGMMALAVRRNAVAVSSGTDGDYEPLQTDSLGRLRATLERTITNVTTAALAASLVIKASPGILYGLQGYSTVAQFLQVYDSTTLPADGAVPKVVIPITAGAPFSIDFGTFGRTFATGIVAGISTTGPTKTIGAANTWIDAQFE